MVKHIVLFKLKEATPETVQAVASTLRNMKGKIAELKGIEVGIDYSHSARSFDVVLITEFERPEDVPVYQAHPVHQEVLKFLNTVVEKSVIADFLTE